MIWGENLTLGSLKAEMGIQILNILDFEDNDILHLQALKSKTMFLNDFKNVLLRRIQWIEKAIVLFQ